MVDEQAHGGGCRDASGRRAASDLAVCVTGGTGHDGRSTCATSRPYATVALASESRDLPLSSPMQRDEVGTLTLADGFTVQVGAFREANRAAAVVQQFRGAGLPAFRRTDANRTRHLVLVGPYVTDGEVQAVQQILADRVSSDESRTRRRGARAAMMNRHACAGCRVRALIAILLYDRGPAPAWAEASPPNHR